MKNFYLSTLYKWEKKTLRRLRNKPLQVNRWQSHVSKSSHTNSKVLNFFYNITSLSDVKSKLECSNSSLTNYLTNYFCLNFFAQFKKMKTQVFQVFIYIWINMYLRQKYKDCHLNLSWWKWVILCLCFLFLLVLTATSASPINPANICKNTDTVICKVTVIWQVI